jgi:SAM-dependent methyltransferase
LTREQRLVFGEVAEDYARERPGYPDALLDDVAALGRRALEVGAGTGKATAGLLARGLEVTALEPSVEMAAVGRRLNPGAEWVVCGLEEYAGAGPFDIVCAAQSWHWVDPERGFARAHALLGPGGWLALFWNRANDGEPAQRRALDAVYARLAPDLADSGHRSDHAAAIRASGLFTEPEQRAYTWSRELSADAYVRLLGTHSNHRLLPDDRRAALQAAVREAIGETIRIDYVTRLYLARKTAGL